MRAFVAFSALQATVFLITTRFVATYLYKTAAPETDARGCRGILLLAMLLPYAFCLLADTLLMVLVLQRKLDDEHRAAWAVLPGVALAYLVGAIDHVLESDTKDVDFPAVADVVFAAFIVVASARFMYGVSESTRKARNVSAHGVLAYGIALAALRDDYPDFPYIHVILFLVFDAIRASGEWLPGAKEDDWPFNVRAYVSYGTLVGKLVVLTILTRNNATTLFVGITSTVFLSIFVVRTMYDITTQSSEL